MSRNRGKDTSPELLLRRALWRSGIRYIVNSDVFGKPDIVFRRKKIAVFVDGCFWHMCPLHYQAPKDNRDYWEKKKAINQARDREVGECLAENGWFVLRFWEHEVKSNLDDCVSRVRDAIDRR